MGFPRRASAEVIQDLRTLIGQGTERVKKERYEFSMRPQGFPRGALIELTGFGKTHVIVQFLAENPGLRVAWLEEDLTIYPCAVAQRKVALPRVLFVEAHKEILWATFQVMRSHLFECIVVSSKKNFDEKNLRRLQLESEKSHVGIFLLSETPHQAWPISLQIRVNRREEKLETLKERGDSLAPGGA